MSSIVSFTLGIVELFRNRRTEAWIFWSIAVLFLIVAFDQAWQDEHRNTSLVIGEKSSAVGEMNFWKEQNYAKDDAVRTRDHLLAQNYTALIGQQTTSNNAQQSLAQLSQRILEIDKPGKLKIDNYYLGDVPSQYNANVKAKYHGTFLVLTNQTVTPIRLLVTCEGKIVQAGGGILGTAASSGGGWGGRVTTSPMQYGIGLLSPAWTPSNPMLATIYTDDPSLGICSFEQR